MEKSFNGPLLLCILDGVGLPTKKQGDAFTLAHTPNLDNLLKTCPNAQLITHGAAVGLPEGQMGNSEVGHITIGAGRVILQSLDLIRQGLLNGTTYASTNWQKAEEACKKSRVTHLIAMVSDGGVHSHTDHIIALAKKLNEAGKPVLIHAITDGRDTAPTCASQQLKPLQDAITNLNNVEIADIIGRFYAMDRDNRTERTAEATNLYSNREGRTFNTVNDAITHAYTIDTVQDEFIKASIVPTQTDARIQDGDTLIFANFRADRMRQIVKHYISACPNSHIVNLTEYDATFANNVNVLFPPTQPKNTIGEVIHNHGGTQLRIAESEKYAHVTFFLNGGREDPFSGEDRIVIPSPKVKTYDLAPAMSIETVTEKLLAAIHKDAGKGYSFICLNIANGDQVGHSGSLDAAIEAMEHVDKTVGQIIQALNDVNGEMILIADHGNCEEMLLDDGSVSTAHSINPVPFIYKGRAGAHIEAGTLADVAPTLLHLLGIKKPVEMSGQNRVTFSS